MSIRHAIRSALHYTLSIIFLVLLTACYNGSGDTAVNKVVSVILSGSVGDGPITGAAITIMDASGSIVATTVSDETANYKVAVPAATTYPVTITATDGIDMVTGAPPDFTMVSIVSDPADTIANINPFSTLIVKTAQAMPGGVNSTNIDLASQSILKQLNFGLDTTQVSNPITTKIMEQNVATIVKSSEVIAEMIRRTRNVLLVTGNTLSEDELINILAADMTDGFLEGSGTDGASAVIAATANIVSGQVLIEAMNNSLEVNGAPATGLMDNAIRLTSPAATDTTADVAINEEMLNQTRIAVDAAQLIVTNEAMAAVTSMLDNLTPGLLPEEIGTLLPIDKSADFNNALTLVALATDIELDQVNTATREALVNATPPIVSLIASPYSVADNGFSTLTWATHNARSCSTSDSTAWDTKGETFGAAVVGPLNTDTTFTLTCTSDNDKTTTKTVTIKVVNTDSKITIPADIGSDSTDANTNGNSNNSPDTANIDNIDNNSADTTNVSGDNSISPSRITLSWEPNTNDIRGYIVYYGDSADTATTEISDIPINMIGFNQQAPSIEYDLASDLGVGRGDSVCFRLRAYNSNGSSDLSTSQCTTI